MRLTKLFELFGFKLTTHPPPKIMSPALLAAIIALVAEAVKDAPQMIADFKEIFSKPNPTPADWESLRQKVLSMSYADYVPSTALASGSAPAEIPAVATPPASEKPVSSDSGGSPMPEKASTAPKTSDPAPVTAGDPTPGAFIAS